MKITAVETLHIAEFPNLLWVIVEADGVRGTGESFFSAPATEAYIHDTAAQLLLRCCPVTQQWHPFTTA